MHGQVDREQAPAQLYVPLQNILIKETLLNTTWNTAREARNLLQGSANLSHSSPLHSPCKPRCLAAAATSHFHASKAAGKDASHSKSSPANPEEMIPSLSLRGVGPPGNL